MRIGSVSLWRDDLDQYRKEVRLADELGFDAATTGDSQSVYREAYVSMAVSAEATSRVLIGPMVTNPVTRHPAVTASGIAAIDRLSGGRAILGIGSGDSALRNVGERPARLAETAAYIRAIQSLQDSGTAEWNGHEVRVQGLERRIPIWLSAEGPRTIELAGSLCDAVLLHSGTSDDAIAFCLSQLRKGAEGAGRNVEDIEVWMMLKTSIADSRAEAIDGIKMGLAGSAHHAFRYSLEQKGVPTELIPAVQELVSRYDTTHHEVAAGRNAGLSDELGLTEFLADSFGLIGTPDDCIEKLVRLEKAGIYGVILPALGPDPVGLIDRIGRDIIAHLPG